MPLPGLSLTVPHRYVDPLVFHSGLDDFRLANLLHQLGHAAGLDELGADVFGKRGKFLDLRREGEEAGEEVKALHEAGEQIDKRLARLQVGNLCRKRVRSACDRELHLGIGARCEQLARDRRHPFA